MPPRVRAKESRPASGSDPIDAADAGRLTDRPRALRQDSLDDTAVVHGRALVPAVMAVRQLEVVHPHQVQDGGVQIVDVDAILDGAQAYLVRRTEGQSRLHAAACHPDREAPGVVVAPL